jgi:hypothetical protein
MTLPQALVTVDRRPVTSETRGYRMLIPGEFCDASTWRTDRKIARIRRRDRRAKRIAKAATRRVARVMVRIEPLLRKLHEAELCTMSVRWSMALAFDTGGTAETLRALAAGPAFMGGSIRVFADNAPEVGHALGS